MYLASAMNKIIYFLRRVGEENIYFFTIFIETRVMDTAREIENSWFATRKQIASH